MSYNRLEDSFKNEKEIHELSFEEAFRSHEEEKNELNAKFREEYTKCKFITCSSVLINWIKHLLLTDDNKNSTEQRVKSP